MNGKTSWISSSNSNALWYNVDSVDWMIGYLGDLGTSTGAISSIGAGISSCPYNVPQDAWKYAAENVGWVIADANDVSIACLNGNDNINKNKVINCNICLFTKCLFWSISNCYLI